MCFYFDTKTGGELNKTALYLLVSANVHYFAWFKIWVNLILNVLVKKKDSQKKKRKKGKKKKNVHNSDDPLIIY